MVTSQLRVTKSFRYPKCRDSEPLFWLFWGGMGIFPSISRTCWCFSEIRDQLASWWLVGYLITIVYDGVLYIHFRWLALGVLWPINSSRFPKSKVSGPQEFVNLPALAEEWPACFFKAYEKAGGFLPSHLKNMGPQVSRWKSTNLWTPPPFRFTHWFPFSWPGCYTPMKNLKHIRWGGSSWRPAKQQDQQEDLVIRTCGIIGRGGGGIFMGGMVGWI